MTIVRFLCLVFVATLPYAALAAFAESTTDAAAVTTSAAPSASTADASNVIKGFYAQLTEAMKQGDQLGFNGRYKKLDPAVKAAFNLPVMTRLSVGPVWESATPDEQKQLIAAFSNFSVATYANQFHAYDGEQFSITGAETVSDGDIIVQTSLKPKDREAVALNYLMRRDEQKKWRVVDIFLDGSISEMAARRSEFSSIAKRDGISALVNSLGEKSKQLGPT